MRLEDNAMAIEDDLALRTLYVGNLAAGTSDEDLQRVFGYCGLITYIRVAG